MALRVPASPRPRLLGSGLLLAAAWACGGGGGGSASGGGAVPPVITQQPANQSTTAGRTATFSVAASGATGYQWQAGSADIPGATGASYTLASATVGQNGASYRVLVSNSGGSVTSGSATLTVNPLPAFTLQPLGLAVTAPAPATFTAAAAGGTAPLVFQWMRGGVAIPGATGTTYQLSPTSAGDNGAAFSIVATDVVGATAASATAVLTVGSAPPPPVVTGMSPASGPPGTVVVLTGTGLAGCTGTTFATGPCAFFGAAETQVLTTVPGTALPGAGSFELITPSGTATTVPFTVTSDPPLSGLTGHVFLPVAGGAPILSPSPVPPAGYSAASGTVVTFMGVSPTGTGTLGGGGASAATSASGRFLLLGLPPGLGKVSVTPAGGTATSFQVTVIAGATAELGPPPVTRAAALALAQAQVPAGTDPKDLFILSPQSPLPAGVVVNQALGNADGDQDATTRFTLPGSRWFFYLDPDANVKFTHAVLYVTVDARTGTVASIPATSAPGLNGPRFYDHPEVSYAAADLAVAPVPLAGPTPALAVPPSPPAPAAALDPCCTPKTWAILVQGADENAAAADIPAIQTMFGNSGLPSPTLSTTTIIGPAGTSPRTQFLAALAQARANAAPCDTIFVYFSAHNSTGNAIELEHKLANGDPAPNDEKITARNLDFQGAKTRNLYLFIDTCNAESTGNATAALNAGTGLTIVCATDTNHGASYSNHWWQGAETGSSFTSGLTGAFGRLSGYTSFSEALNVAFNQTAIALGNSIWKNERAMNPKLVFAPPGNSHSLSPTCLVADHIPGTTSCPQALGTVTITNTGNAPQTWSVSNPMAFVSLDVSSGTLAPGASVAVHPSFNCTNYTTGLNSGKLTFTVKNQATNAVSNGPVEVAISLTVH